MQWFTVTPLHTIPWFQRWAEIDWQIYRHIKTTDWFSQKMLCTVAKYEKNRLRIHKNTFSPPLLPFAEGLLNEKTIVTRKGSHVVPTFTTTSPGTEWLCQTKDSTPTACSCNRFQNINKHSQNLVGTYFAKICVIFLKFPAHVIKKLQCLLIWILILLKLLIWGMLINFGVLAR